MDDILKSRMELYDQTVVASHVTRKVIPPSDKHLINSKFGASETVDSFVLRKEGIRSAETRVKEKLLTLARREISVDCQGCDRADFRFDEHNDPKRHATVFVLTVGCRKDFCDRAGYKEVIEFDGLGAVKAMRKLEAKIEDNKVIGSW
jgi:hypothetical protein